MLELKANLDKTKEDIYQKATIDAKAEADKILDGFEADMQKYQDEIARLSHELKSWNLKIAD